MILGNVKTSTRIGTGRSEAFTLIEVVVSIIIGAMMVGAIISGYSQAANRAEWSAYSLAAQSLAMQGMELARAAKWDKLAFPTVDQLVGVNFPVTNNILDIPITGTNNVIATNYTTITVISADPPLKMISVNTVWRFWNRGLFTNSVATYRAPDQ